jgi:hypothetical protein
LRSQQKFNPTPTDPKLCENKVEIQQAIRFDDRSVGVVPKNDFGSDVIFFSQSDLTTQPAMALNMRLVLRMSVL